MKRRITVQVLVEKRGLLGFKHTVMEKRTVEVDNKTYKKLRQEQNNHPYSIEEMMLYDDIFDED